MFRPSPMPSPSVLPILADDCLASFSRSSPSLRPLARAALKPASVRSSERTTIRTSLLTALDHPLYLHQPQNAGVLSQCLAGCAAEPVTHSQQGQRLGRFV